MQRFSYLLLAAPVLVLADGAAAQPQSESVLISAAALPGASDPRSLTPAAPRAIFGGLRLKL